MSDPRLTLPVGDAARRLNLPKWLRWILDLFKGTKISAGPVDIQLDQEQGIPAVKTGLDQPHKFGPPPVGRR